MNLIGHLRGSQRHQGTQGTGFVATEYPLNLGVAHQKVFHDGPRLFPVIVVVLKSNHFDFREFLFDRFLESLFTSVRRLTTWVVSDHNDFTFLTDPAGQFLGAFHAASIIVCCHIADKLLGVDSRVHNYQWDFRQGDAIHCRDYGIRVLRCQHDAVHSLGDEVIDNGHLSLFIRFHSRTRPQRTNTEFSRRGQRTGMHRLPKNIGRSFRNHSDAKPFLRTLFCFCAARGMKTQRKNE